jgi:hypothetical protein
MQKRPVSGGEGNCAGCRERLMVFGPELLTFLPEEARADVRAGIAGRKGPEGILFTVADDDGWFTCPECGTRGRYTAHSVN